LAHFEQVLVSKRGVIFFLGAWQFLEVWTFFYNRFWIDLLSH
jgi:hypothetical protein